MRCSSRGEVWVEAVYRDGRTELLLQRHNQLTYGFLQAQAALLLQKSSDLAPEQRRLGSIWFEAFAGSQPDPAPTDEGPNELSEVVAQIAIDDSSRRIYQDGEATVIEVTALLDTDQGNGSTLSFLGLYTEGDGTLPDPDEYVAGTNNIYCVARLRLGVAKNDGFALRAGWRIYTTVEVDSEE